jgi:hypothetical protein
LQSAFDDKTREQDFSRVLRVQISAKKPDWDRIGIREEDLRLCGWIKSHRG